MQKILIIGSGMNGMCMATALAVKSRHNLEITMLEKAELSKLHAPKQDARSIVLNNASVQLFKELGIWQSLSENAQPIREIRIADNFSPAHLHLSSEQIEGEILGYTCDVNHIIKSMKQRLQKLSMVSIIDNSEVKKLSYEKENIVISTSKNQKFSANLLIAADGRNSSICKILGIKKSKKDYQQTAIVCSINHQKPHNSTALEHFFKDGVFATLPMKSPIKNSNRSGVVWCEKPEIAEKIINLPEKEFLEKLQEKSGDWLGEMKLQGKIFSYPLQLQHIKKYYDKKIAIIGDAAHNLHPLAGQGVNLGFQDVKSLTNIIAEHVALGINIGGDTMLQSYQKSRKLHNLAIIGFTDNLNRVFANDILPLKLARRIGMKIVNNVKPMKKLMLKLAVAK